MSKPYLYQSGQNAHNTAPTRAVLVLPEIFGVTDFIKQTTDKFSKEFSAPAFALDHFYSVAARTDVFDYETGMDAGSAVGKQMTGQGFYSLLTKALNDIQAELPSVKEFVVCGFCFGGRLAYLAGMDKRVNRIISFYGAGANSPYFEGKSPIEALIAARSGDKEFRGLSFFGGQDGSIPPEDRATTKQSLIGAGITYTARVYPGAGHAYFNDSRVDRYNSNAAQKSWKAIKEFLSH